MRRPTYLGTMPASMVSTYQMHLLAGFCCCLGLDWHLVVQGILPVTNTVISVYLHVYLL